MSNAYIPERFVHRLMLVVCCQVSQQLRKRAYSQHEIDARKRSRRPGAASAGNVVGQGKGN